MIDLATRMVVGWQLATHMRTSLITDALQMASDSGHVQAGAVFHSDRGAQGGFNGRRDTSIKEVRRSRDCGPGGRGAVMTATLDGVTTKKPDAFAEAEAARELVRLAKEQGLSLTGPDGLLERLTKTVIETALDEEITGHLGYEKHDPAGQGAGSGNVRNGSRPKTVLTDSTGQVAIDVPRDRAGAFEPQIVRKRQRRLAGVDEIVLSLYAKGLTTGEISAHFAEIYGASVSKETVSRITDKVIEEMQSWQNRPLDQVYAVVFIDAIRGKVRDGQVANRPVYAGDRGHPRWRKDILGLWAGRRRRRRRQVLDVGAAGHEEPRDRGRVLPGLRRAQGPARRGREPCGRWPRSRRASST